MTSRTTRLEATKNNRRKKRSGFDTVSVTYSTSDYFVCEEKGTLDSIFKKIFLLPRMKIIFVRIAVNVLLSVNQKIFSLNYQFSPKADTNNIYSLKKNYLYL